MKAIVKPVLILTVICMVMTAAVAGVHLLTKDAISANEAATAQASMAALIPDVTFTAVGIFNDFRWDFGKHKNSSFKR